MMGLELEREAKIVDGRLACPYCNSDKLSYAEDVIRLYPIRRIVPGDELIVMDEIQATHSPALTAEPGEGDDERIVCDACGEACRVPECYATVFEE